MILSTQSNLGKQAFEINPNVVITGDTNADLFNTHNNKLLEIMTLFNLKNVINKPTRITAHSSTLLDPIIISDTMSSIYSDVLNVPSEISDHDAAVAYIECPNCTNSSFKREIWLHDRIDKETFKQKLDQTDWNALLGSLNDVDEMCNTFTETFVQIARECIPTKFVMVKNNDKPWFTSALRTEIRRRDRFRKIVLKSKTESSILRYKQQRNKVNNLKRNAKENFEKNLDNIINRKCIKFKRILEINENAY